MAFKKFFEKLFKNTHEEENTQNEEQEVKSTEEDLTEGGQVTSSTLEENAEIQETQETEEEIASETQENEEEIASETQEDEEKVASESQEIEEEEITSESQEIEEEVASESQEVEEEIVSETQEDEEVVVSESQENEEDIASESQEVEEEIALESQENEEEEVASETQKVEEEVISETQENEEDKKVSIFEKLKQGLKKTSENFTDKVENLFKRAIEIDDDFFDEMEEILITSDISFDTAMKIVDQLRENVESKKIQSMDLVREEIKEIIYEMLYDENSKLDLDHEQNIIVVIGVNGVGKTTTIGKLSHRIKNQGKTVVLAAADTFRAAATEQLQIWADRVGIELVKNVEGSDPSSIIFDAINKAKSKKTDVLICDTAGRLHNKKNLMNELEKIFKIVNREYPDAHKEVLLVIDATTGQNALSQVKTFSEVAPLTGIVLTKLDGTAKGGAIISIKSEYNIPIKFVGVGEKTEDLQIFDARNFVDALFYR